MAGYGVLRRIRGREETNLAEESGPRGAGVMDLHAHMICQHNEIRREHNACGVSGRHGETRGNDGVSERGNGEERWR